MFMVTKAIIFCLSQYEFLFVSTNLVHEIEGEEKDDIHLFCFIIVLLQYGNLSHVSHDYERTRGARFSLWDSLKKIILFN